MPKQPLSEKKVTVTYLKDALWCMRINTCMCERVHLIMETICGQELLFGDCLRALVQLLWIDDLTTPERHRVTVYLTNQYINGIRNI